MVKLIVSICRVQNRFAGAWNFQFIHEHLNYYWSTHCFNNEHFSLHSINFAHCSTFLNMLGHFLQFKITSGFLILLPVRSLNTRNEIHGSACLYGVVIFAFQHHLWQFHTISPRDVNKSHKSWDLNFFSWSHEVKLSNSENRGLLTVTPFASHLLLSKAY